MANYQAEIFAQLREIDSRFSILEDIGSAEATALGMGRESENPRLLQGSVLRALGKGSGRSVLSKTRLRGLQVLHRSGSVKSQFVPVRTRLAHAT